jgi:peptidoglycan/LPS O-acetylase OafA/YrhL
MGAFLKTPQESARQGGRIDVLDGFRALAILAVMFYHYIYSWTYPVDSHGHIPVDTPLSRFVPFEYGWMGVYLFFGISGFVILMTLERCRHLGDFAIRRFARLWPPLFVAATITTIVMALIGPPDWVVNRNDYLLSVAIIDPFNWLSQKFLPGVKWVDGAYWSLWCEVRFYALASVIYLLARRNFVAVWLVFQAVVAGLELLRMDPHSNGGFLLDLIAFPPQLPYFTLGICIYEIYSGGRLRNLAIPGLVLVACLMLADAVFEVSTFKGKAALPSVMGVCIILTLFGLFAIGHPVLNIFRSRPLVMLGQASYSFYLIHMHVGVSIIRYAILHGVPYLAALPATMVLMFAAALLLFRLVEVPAKTLILKRTANLVGRMERLAPWLSYGLAPAKTASP